MVMIKYSDPKVRLVNSQKLKKMLDSCATPSENVVYMENRNPRNLEMMRIAYRPNGYHLEQPGNCFWHR